MRVIDILSEASVLHDKYGPGSLFKVSSATKGQALAKYIKEYVDDFETSDILEKVSVEPLTSSQLISKSRVSGLVFAGVQKPPLFKVTFKREGKKPITIIAKKDLIEGGMTKHYASKEGEPTKFSASVKGLVAEALLGVAMYAKLTARGGDLTAHIVPEDIWAVVDRVKPTGDDEIGDSVKDRKSKVSDHIALIIKMRTDVQHVFTDPQFRPSFHEEVASWIKYANSSLAQRYADVLYKNQRPDNITILLAGKAGEKLDVAINVLDSKGRPTSQLQQVKLSVKLSDGLMGQAPRGDNPEEVYDNLSNLFAPLGVSLEHKKNEIIASAQKHGIKQQFVPAAAIGYTEAYQQLMSVLQMPEGDAAVAEKLAQFADSHATANDPTMHVIEKYGKGDYRLLNYKGLAQVFQEQNINITCSLDFGTSSKTGGAKTPTLTFYDSNNPGPSGRLMKMWVRGRGGEGKEYANTVIEPGRLMKDLAAFRRHRKPEHVRVPAPATPAAPVAQTSAPIPAPIPTTKKTSKVPGRTRPANTGQEIVGREPNPVDNTENEYSTELAERFYQKLDKLIELKEAKRSI